MGTRVETMRDTLIAAGIHPAGVPVGVMESLPTLKTAKPLLIAVAQAVADNAIKNAAGRELVKRVRKVAEKTDMAAALEDLKLAVSEHNRDPKKAYNLTLGGQFSKGLANLNNFVNRGNPLSKGPFTTLDQLQVRSDEKRAKLLDTWLELRPAVDRLFASLAARGGK